MNSSGISSSIGRVAGVWRYPVKSMAAEPLSTAEISWHGVTGDRRWAFVRNGVEQSGFPWLTLRERSDMNRFTPFFADPAQPDKSRTLVRTCDGREFDVTDPSLASLLWPGSRVIRQDRGIFDTFPISLISVQSLASLEKIVGAKLEVERFRPNVLIDASGDAPFPEDDWVGRVIAIGGLRLRVDKRDGRCAVIAIDPKTSERNPSVLRAVAKERDGCMGVYASVVSPGSIEVNDSIRFD